jgi:hypothetical protein
MDDAQVQTDGRSGLLSADRRSLPKLTAVEYNGMIVGKRVV